MSRVGTIHQSLPVWIADAKTLTKRNTSVVVMIRGSGLLGQRVTWRGERKMQSRCRPCRLLSVWTGVARCRSDSLVPTALRCCKGSFRYLAAASAVASGPGYRPGPVADGRSCRAAMTITAASSREPVGRRTGLLGVDGVGTRRQ